MSVVSLLTHYEYLCNGVTTLFTIPFQYHAVEDLKIVLVDTTDDNSETELVAGVDFTWDGDVLHPTGITTAVTYSSDYQLHMRRTTQLTQEHDYIDNGEFLAEDHEKAIDKPVMMIQELSEKHDNLSDIVDDHEQRITQNEEDIDALEAQMANGGVPAILEEWNVLETRDDGDGIKSLWSLPLVYNGFTERWNELINLSGIKAVLDYIMKMGYAPPTISLTSSVSTANREKGNAITSMTLSALVGKVLDDIAEVRFYQNPSTLLDAQTSGPAIPNGGTNTYSWSGSFADTTSFRAEVDDDSVEAKPSRTSTITYNFFYAWLHGKGGAGESAANVYAMNKTIGNPSSSQAVSYTLAVGEKPYFAYPATFADLTSIKNINNLETIGSWTKRTENITNAYGETTSYKIYEFNNLAGEANSNTYTFIR